LVINCPVMKIQIRKLLVSATFSVCFIHVAWAGLAEQIDSIIGQSSQKKVQYSIAIVKADSGEVVYAHNANEAMIPASNMKIIIGAAALKYLRPDYEFKTKVGLCGDTLVVIGGGDPLLGDETTDAKYNRKRGWIFKDIAAALKQNNVAAIKDIVVDGSMFDNERVHPSWPREQLNQWYACEVSGLNYNDNCVAITVKNTDGKITSSIEPETGFIRITNKVVPTSRKGKSAVGAYRNLTPNSITLKGKCRRQEGPFNVAIERPAEFFGFLLRENLVRAGIDVSGQVIEKPTDCDTKKIVEYSTLMTDCLARCSKNSLGLAAEALVKTIAAKVAPSGKNGSWAEGRKLVDEYMLSLGIERKEFYVDDGSGLSRANKLSASAITKVLLDVYKSKNWEIYKNSLAVGGIDGTIGKYFKEEKYKGKVFGKTGYISGVKSFSGVCSGKGGDYIFSILANKSRSGTRKAINDITKAIMDDN
jgi:D-alanyl-D-alanine carboxypeptidase/D-alanyl-D-alanine-endopeptidase (penicillin-binding protein 4)